MTAPEVNPVPPRHEGRPSERVLRRDQHDRVIGGVCAGLGRYLGIDPVLVRIVFVVLAVAGGSGVLAYLLAWVLIPEERPGDAASPVPPPAAGGSQVVVGALLVAAGAAMLLDQVVPGFRQVLGPLVLIFVGISVVALARRR